MGAAAEGAGVLLNEVVRSKGLCMKSAATEEARLDEGNILQAESALREGLSLNYEEARALLGRLEYQRGNVEAALRVFEGIDLQAAVQRLQTSFPDKSPSRRSRSRNESFTSTSQHAASLVLEAIYLKSMSLQKLGKVTEAAEECKSILDAVEKIFHHGIPDTLVDSRLQETVSRAVELLPELWKLAGNYQESLASYRRALLSEWKLDSECCVRLQKRFITLLLFGGVETGSPSLASQIDGSFIPKNNLEEAILLLTILLRKWHLGQTKWDPFVMENLTFAFSLCNHSSTLARHFEELLPGLYSRSDRWNYLALCYSAGGKMEAALNLLDKSLNKHEDPDNVLALSLAARICSKDPCLASKGVKYAHKLVANAQLLDKHVKSMALRLLGVCLSRQATTAASDHERLHLRAEALTSLNEAISLDPHNPDVIYDLGLEYAENHNLNAALRCSKEFIDATGGSFLKGWRLLALLLFARKQYHEADVVIDAVLAETSKWEQEPLLKIKAKLKAAQSLPMESVETYRFLLALIQAQKKGFGILRNSSQFQNEEFEVWHGLASLYSSLSHWTDSELCLEKARAMKPFSAALLHMKGTMLESRGDTQQSLIAYVNALFMDQDHVLSKISIASLLWRTRSNYPSAAKCFLSDAQRIEPTNRLAWHSLGMIYKEEGKFSEAADCFQAASTLESDSLESFDWTQ